MAQFIFAWKLQKDAPFDGNPKMMNGLSVCEFSQSYTIEDFQLQYKYPGRRSISHALNHLVQSQINSRGG